MPETKHDIPLSQNISDSDTLKKSNGSSMKPASKSRLFSSSEALYKEIYYSRRIKKILDRANNPDEYATLQKKAKKKVKSRLRLMMAYNWVFLVAIVFAVIGFSRGWFKPNTIIESRDMSFLVFDSNFPAYLSASFNGVSLFDYRDEEYVLSKTILPGDVINLSVFMDFTGIVSIESELCDGCMACEQSCPYNHPVKFADGLAHKCVLCSDQNLEGVPDPTCWAACPIRALDFGSIADLREKYGTASAIGTLDNATHPNVVIGVHRDADKGGAVMNPQEIGHEA